MQTSPTPSRSIPDSPAAAGPNDEACARDLWFCLWRAYCPYKSVERAAAGSGRSFYTFAAVAAMGGAVAVFLKGAPPWREPVVTGFVFVVAALEALRSRAAMRAMRRAFAEIRAPVEDPEPLRAAWRHRLERGGVPHALRHLKARDELRWYRSFAAVLVFVALMFPDWFEPVTDFLHIPSQRAWSALALVAAVLIPAWFVVNLTALKRDTAMARERLSRPCCLACGAAPPEIAAAPRCGACGAAAPLLPPPCTPEIATHS